MPDRKRSFTIRNIQYMDGAVKSASYRMKAKTKRKLISCKQLFKFQGGILGTSSFTEQHFP